MEIDWAAPAAWDVASSKFRAPRNMTHYVGSVFFPTSMDYGWSKLRERWLALPQRGNLLEAIAPSDHGVMLRYAAINGWKPVVRLATKSSSRRIASIGAQLSEVFETLLEKVSGPDLGLFLQPFALIDLDDQVRVGFESGSSARPPEMKLDERAFIFVLGRLWTTLIDDIPPDNVGTVIRRCIDIDRRARFSSFEKLRFACLDLSAPYGLRSGQRLDDWYQIEEAVGWRAVGDLVRAHAGFRRVRARGPTGYYFDLAVSGMALTQDPSKVDTVAAEPSPPPAPPPPPALPSPARASYLEGRDLLLRRKLHEAHVCFSSAILLDPMMLEAQLLRRQVERMLGRLRATTGTPNPQPIDVPASLRDVRDLVVAGRIRDAIAKLSSEAYADNVDAPLFRARLLALDGQYERAASAFASITDGPHVDEARLGLARANIDRGNHGAALAILEDLLATRPRDLGALEARARCLELLGRTDEASEAMRAFVAAVELASDARLSRAP